MEGVAGAVMEGDSIAGAVDRPSRSEIENAATARLESQRASASTSDPAERVSGEESKASDDAHDSEPPTNSESAAPAKSGAGANGKNGRASSLPALPPRASASPDKSAGSQPAGKREADSAEGQGPMISDKAAPSSLPPPRRSLVDAIGKTLDGRYRVEERLGVGGVGAVYLGTQLALGRQVAIKLLHEGLDPSFRTRFQREAKALASLRHPNVVSVTDYGVTDDMPYLVMEMLEGETLGDRLLRGPLLPDHVLEVTRQLLGALGFVHEHGLVHRDLKPGNLFIELTPDGDERIKLLDFGLAKFIADPGTDGQTVTRAGHVVGTPAYMAPEQIAGDAVDARTDIYAVGVLLFQTLTGKVPFEGEPMDQLKGHLVAPVPSLEVTRPGLYPRRELTAFVMRALEKPRDKRFQSALEMLDALEAIPQPWLLDEPLVDDHGAKDGSSDQTLVHKGSAARHKKAQGKSSFTLRAVWILALCLLGLAGLNHFRSGQSAGESDKREAADKAQAPAAAAPAQAVDKDMVIGLAETQKPIAKAPEEPAAAQTAEPAAPAAIAEAPAAQAAAPIAPAATPAAPATAATPGGRNPWAREVPGALRAIRKAVMDGSPGNDRMIAVMRKYNRSTTNDARGHLLLAHMYLNRGWREDALNQYQNVYQVDPSARGAIKMLSDLLALVAYNKTSRDAARFVREVYGTGALREIDRAISAYARDPAAVARLKALRASLGGA